MHFEKGTIHGVALVERIKSGQHFYSSGIAVCQERKDVICTYNSINPEENPAIAIIDIGDIRFYGSADISGAWIELFLTIAFTCP